MDVGGGEPRGVHFQRYVRFVHARIRSGGAVPRRTPSGGGGDSIAGGVAKICKKRIVHRQRQGDGFGRRVSLPPRRISSGNGLVREVHERAEKSSSAHR